MLSESEDIVRELERRRKRRERLRRRQEEVGGGAAAERGSRVGDSRERPRPWRGGAEAAGLAPGKLCSRSRPRRTTAVPQNPERVCPPGTALCLSPVSCAARRVWLRGQASQEDGSAASGLQEAFSRDPSINNAHVLSIWEPLLTLCLCWFSRLAQAHLQTFGRPLLFLARDVSVIRVNLLRCVFQVCDEPEELKRKVSELAAAVRSARHLVIYTGAGISTVRWGSSWSPAGALLGGALPE